MSGAVGRLCGAQGTAESSQLTEDPRQCDVEEVDILAIDQQPLIAMLPFCRQSSDIIGHGQCDITSGSVVLRRHATAVSLGYASSVLLLL